MGEFGLANSVDFLDLAADVFGQFLRGFLAFVIDFNLDKEIRSHPLAVH
jgi:hypothetical protein